jgi:flavorubredoxin
LQWDEHIKYFQVQNGDKWQMGCQTLKIIDAKHLRRLNNLLTYNRFQRVAKIQHK